MSFSKSAFFAAAFVLFARQASAQGAPLLNGFGGGADFGVDQLAPDDDGSSTAIQLVNAFPAGLHFGGSRFDVIYVNVNGNVSFGAPLSTFTPTAFPGASVPMVAAWWGDVDTRGALPTAAPGIYWHIESGRFVATWFEVGYFDQHTDLVNSFQIVITDATAAGTRGDFDLEFRYNRCEWTTGDMSGGDGGLGGTIAVAGYDGTSLAGGAGFFSTLPGSGAPEVLSLCTDSNVGEPGVWRLEVRNGAIAYCGDGIVQTGEECDGPDVAAPLGCTTDCHLCGGATGPSCVEQDAGFEDVEQPDAAVGDVVTEFDVTPADASSMDATADAGSVVRNYGGGGLFSCAVRPGRRGAVGFALAALAGAMVAMRHRRRPR